MDLIVRNARFPDRKDLVDLAVKGDTLTEVGPRLPSKAIREIDADGNLVSPPFIDPHLHLDAVLTAGIPRYNISGSHPEGIQVWGEYKKAFPGFEDFKDRARRAVRAVPRSPRAVGFERAYLLSRYHIPFFHGCNIHITLYTELHCSSRKKLIFKMSGTLFLKIRFYYNNAPLDSIIISRPVLFVVCC